MQTPENRANRTTVLLITTVLSFLIPFMGSALNIALPSIGNEFNLNVVLLSWVTTVYILASASLLIPFGKLADIYGRAKIFIIGTIVFTIGCALAIFSVNGTMLIIMRGVQGIGGAASFATCAAILTSEFPVEERGKVLGINAAAIYLGLSVGPPLGGIITSVMGWRGIFFFTSVVSVLVTIATVLRMKTTAVLLSKEKFDLISSVIYTLILVQIMSGISLLSATVPVATVLIAAGVILGVAFFWTQSRSKKPLIDLSIFKNNRGFTFSNLAALANYSGTWAVSFLLSLYLQYNKGFDPLKAGLIMIASPVIQAIVSPISGRLSDRIEPRILSSVGMAISALGIGMLTVINKDTSISYIVVCLLILGFGYAMFSSPNTYAVMSSVQRKYLGIASATLGTMRQVGMMLSMAICTIVFNLVIGQVEIVPQYYPALITSIRIILAISAGICVVAVFASLSRGNVHLDEPDMEVKV
jgi:EmrB/QacA subfamily drug resistance transporter